MNACADSGTDHLTVVDMRGTFDNMGQGHVPFHVDRLFPCSSDTTILDCAVVVQIQI